MGIEIMCKYQTIYTNNICSFKSQPRYLNRLNNFTAIFDRRFLYHLYQTIYTNNICSFKSQPRYLNRLNNFTAIFDRRFPNTIFLSFSPYESIRFIADMSHVSAFTRSRVTELEGFHPVPRQTSEVDQQRSSVLHTASHNYSKGPSVQLQGGRVVSCV